MDQDSCFYLISFNVLIACLLKNARILLGEFHVNHYLGVKGLRTSHTYFGVD